MPLYRVGYSSHEEAPDILLFNETEMSETEFEQLILDIIPTVYREVRAKREKERADLDAALEKQERDLLPSCLHITFQDLYQPVAERLVSQYGFKYAEIAGSFMPFGWSQVDVEGDWGDNCALLSQVTERLKEEGVDVITAEEQQKKEEEQRRKRREIRARRRAERDEGQA